VPSIISVIRIIKIDFWIVTVTIEFAHVFTIFLSTCPSESTPVAAITSDFKSTHHLACLTFTDLSVPLSLKCLALFLLASSATKFPFLV
jgi:hypothetical protein